MACRIHSTPATLNAFRDDGLVQATVEAGEQDAEQALARLANLSIDLGAITEKLLADGIPPSRILWNELLASLKEKRRVLESRWARNSERSHCVTCAEIKGLCKGARR
jgi:hypothetical protein